jgi:hypothetical protein
VKQRLVITELSSELDRVQTKFTGLYRVAGVDRYASEPPVRRYAFERTRASILVGTASPLLECGIQRDRRATPLLERLKGKNASLRASFIVSDVRGCFERLPRN